MTKEDIEKAAVDSCVIENSIFNPELIPYYEQGFKDGAEWRINSVWHCEREMPDTPDLTLVEFPDGRIDIVYFHSIKSWRSMVKRNGIIRWTYINDLIPNMKE